LIEQALILAAGAGSRIVGHVAQPHKAMVEVAGKPILHHTCERLLYSGVRDIVITINPTGEPLRTMMQACDSIQDHLTFVVNEEWERGNGTSVLAAAPSLRDRFILTMADHVFDPKIVASMCQQRVHRGQVALAIDRKLRDIHDMDDATKALLEGDRVRALGKQLEHFNAIDTGMFACSSELIDSVRLAASPGGDVTLSAGLQSIIEAGQLGYADVGDAWWQDVDTPSALQHAELLVSRDSSG